ncbi:beta-lactamase family protein [Nonomuraea sp. FMUSA5-5]|uniref:Beta-lactamase family protein n=1 Tax=Nonomuraea composti TaxID=2720023 RepID=A0ABX1B799_9ACTN|nr:serine hydrolase domain-containing protein [Nonomuraea sp. FMUSA5-5]NJP91624.1 beta-lactamase family protein [Nonomuraea sp. FMUSA5-5]
MAPEQDRIEHLLLQGVRDQVYPGAVWAVGDADGILFSGSCGLLDPTDPDHPMRPDTVFDIASLTKIIAVWSAIGTLWEERCLNLHDPLAALMPDLDGHQLGQVTVHHLLTHTAGVPLRANLKNLYGTDPQAIREGVLHEPLHRPPGEAVEYTDRAALILGFLAEELVGRPLDQLARTRVWLPLGMNDTRFGPLPTALTRRCAPTEYDQETGRHLRGVAHDFSARLLGGVCGIAGAFSVMNDLAIFLRHLLKPSTDAGGFGEDWTRESLQIHTGDRQPARGLFWHPAPGTTPEDDIYVHYGFTGTGMWISRERNRWGLLLTNKLYYGRERQPMADIRNAFRSLTFA